MKNKTTETEDLTANGTTTNPAPLREGYSRLRVQFDIEYKGTSGETNDDLSLTEPDMSMSVRQMLQQASGVQPSQQRQPLYFNMEVPTFNDLTDIDRYREQLISRTTQVDQFIQNEKQAQQKAKEEAEAQAAKETEAAQAKAPPQA